MPRYIDLDKLNEYPIRLNHYDKENGNINFVYGIESVLEYANSLPVFETEIEIKKIESEKLNRQEVKYGHWVHGVCGANEYIKCSICRKIIVNNIVTLEGDNAETAFALCPYCGTKMDCDILNKMEE